MSPVPVRGGRTRNRTRYSPFRLKKQLGGSTFMTTRRKGLTRRAALAGLAGISGLAATDKAPAQDQPSVAPRFKKVPIKGKAGPGLEFLDEAMLDVMDRHGIPGAAVAFAKDGKLLFAR